MPAKSSVSKDLTHSLSTAQPVLYGIIQNVSWLDFLAFLLGRSFCLLCFGLANKVPSHLAKLTGLDTLVFKFFFFLSFFFASFFIDGSHQTFTSLHRKAILSSSIVGNHLYLKGNEKAALFIFHYSSVFCDSQSA